MTHMIRRKFRFLQREEGAATVETVLWFPLLMAVFGMMLDVAMIFHGQAKVLRVVQDANREFSIGRYADGTATEAAITAELAILKVWPTSTATTSRADGVATTTVSVPASQLTVIGFFSALDNFNIAVTAEHMIENWET